MTTAFATLSLGNVVLLAFWTVFVAELVGDKSIYTVATVSMRFRAQIILPTMILAFAGKMFAAVLLGRLVVQLHSPWTDVLSAVAFFSSALFIWVSDADPPAADREPGRDCWQSITVCFGSLFFTEWGDPGQMAVVALTIKTHSLLAPWLGGTLAMVTKGGLALTVGCKMRDRIPYRTVRTLASASCCLLGVFALHRAVFPS